MKKKWLVIGFMGATAMVLIFSAFVLFKFSPIIEVDNEKNRVRILGGLIDVSDTGGTFSFGKDISHQPKAKNVSGTMAIDTTKITGLKIPFKNGKIQLETAADNKLTWSCRIGGIAKDQQLISTEGENIIFALDQSNAADCILQIPAGMNLNLAGDNGHINVEKPRFNLDVQVKNARISITPDKSAQYKYDINVINGKIDDFESSSNKHAYKIAVNLDNGRVSRD